MSVAVAHLKELAARQAVKFVQSGMIVGLGSGSTALAAMRYLAERLKDGALQNIIGIPSSTGSEREARLFGIPLSTLEENPTIDLTIDGADEVDPELKMIKGGGGALLREKIVAQASRRVIIIIDETKLSPTLGTSKPLPVEVLQFGWRTQANFLIGLGAQLARRHNDDGSPYLTDQDNYILDCDFGPIEHPALLAERLNSRAGIIEHGLFLDLATDLIVAGELGIRHLKRDEETLWEVRVDNDRN